MDRMSSPRGTAASLMENNHSDLPGRGTTTIGAATDNVQGPGSSSQQQPDPDAASNQTVGAADNPATNLDPVGADGTQTSER